MKRIIPILIAILICFGVGCTASYFQSESILNWYPALEKPSCTPPDIAFPIAWSFIYLCMGMSIGLIWHIWTIRRQMIIRLFGFQLLFNFTWSIFFFLNSATLQFNIIYKCLSNKKLPRILPCQNFHLPQCCEKKTSKTLI